MNCNSSSKFQHKTLINPFYISLMELEFSSFIVLLSFFLLIYHFKSSKLKLNLPPGPRKLPFIGNLHLFVGSDPPYRVLRELAKKYGPLMHLQFGEVGTVVVSSPEIAKEFLNKHDIIFASRPSLLATEINCYGNTDIAFAPYGKYWRQLRKICVLELLTTKRVQSFQPIREEEVSNFCKWIAQNAGSTINLTEKLSMINLNIMVRAAFGKKVGEQAMLKAIIKEGLNDISVYNIVDVYPSIKFLINPFSLTKRKLEMHHQHLDRISENIINERKQANARKGNKQDHDLLDVLLKIQGDGSLEIPLTNNNIKSVLVDLFGAGLESSTTIVDWVMVEMLKNPGVLKRAQDEVRKVFDGKNRVDECYFDELKYLRLVIKETLRLHPPGPLLLPRESSERCEINGYEIPARTRVLVNAWAIGRDPNHWEDAESFKPERFLEKSIDFNGSNLEYIPFGGGRRICPGIAFGIAGVEIELAMLLYHFDWILPNGMKPEDMDMAEFCGLAAQRKCKLCIIPVIRRPLLD